MTGAHVIDRYSCMHMGSVYSATRLGAMGKPSFPVIRPGNIAVYSIVVGHKALPKVYECVIFGKTAGVVAAMMKILDVDRSTAHGTQVKTTDACGTVAL